VSRTELRVATDESYFLAEGPWWDEARQRLLWVDIRNGLVLAGRLLADGRIIVDERLELPRTVGAVATSLDGEWIIAGHDRLHYRGVDGHLVDGPMIIADSDGRRLNDGKPDPQGRYLVGSLAFGGDSTSEVLALVDGDEVRVLDDDLTLSNGLAWSVDGSVMYSIDTERHTIFRRRWSSDPDAVGAREVFVTLDDGYPDGMTVDSEDHLWVAVWGLGRVQRYSADGDMVDVIETPAPHTSSVAFAGPDLRTLVITSSVQDLSDDELGRFPDSGRLFTVEPGVSGAPQRYWRGSQGVVSR
jgi:sugar lactone lactonase YvrE